jgi:hypothetical protein
VTVDIVVDERVIRLPDGTEVPSLHRWVVADAGFRQLSQSDPSRRGPIYDSGQPSHEMQLLDGRGRQLALPSAPPGAAVESANPRGLPDYYEVAKNKELVVPAPGVLLNDSPVSDPLGSLVGGVAGALPGSLTAEIVTPPPGGDGSVTLNADGSFTFTPATDFVGWTTFTYKPKTSSATGTATSVFIQVRPELAPFWNSYDRFEYRDWAAISQLLVGW